jgi:hypothetical protein
VPPYCSSGNASCIASIVNGITSGCQTADADGAIACHEKLIQCEFDGFSEAKKLVKGTSIPGAWGAKTLLNRVLVRIGLPAVTDAEFVDLGGAFFLGFFMAWGGTCEAEESLCLARNQVATQSCINNITVPSGVCGC